MNPIDLAVIAVYVTGCTALGAWLGSRSQGLKGYFLGESNIPAWAVMISIVATETSTATFLSVPGVAYKEGGDFRFLQLAFGYLLGRVIVATVLLPAYFRGEIFTAYQLLKDRFGGPTRTTASLLFLVARSLGDGLRLFLAATMLKHLTGWSVETAIVAVAAITVVYTFLGGMKAVIWTDVIQFSVYILGALVALGILAGKLPGGWTELFQTAQANGKFRLLDFSFDLTQRYTFWAGLIGGMVLNTATHGADQMMVQRVSLGPLATAGRHGTGVQRLHHLGPVRVLPADRRQSVCVLRGVSAFGRVRQVRRSLQLFHRPLPADRRARAGHRVGLLGGDGDPGRLAELVGLVDRQRPVPAGHRPRRRATLAARLAGDDDGLGPCLDDGRFRRPPAREQRGGKRLDDRLVRLGHPAGPVPAGDPDAPRRADRGAGGALAGIAAVSAVAFATPLAWPWFALVGASTVFAVGLATSYVFPTRADAQTAQSGA